MEENRNVENEISLSEIFYMLWKKVKLIVVFCLIACTLGGVFGYLKSHNVVYYGTELTFFVTPKKIADEENNEIIYGTYGNTIMDSMVKLLSTEKSISDYLSDIEGVPEKPVYTEDMDLAVYEQQVKEYNKYVYAVKQSLTFTYRKTEISNSSTDTESKNFIYVEIKVLESETFSKEFTRQLLSQLQVKVPQVVQGAMLNPDESQYAETSCTLVTPIYPMVEVMNPNYTLTETVKFAVLLALAVFVIVCVVIIVSDRMDKRIREIDRLESKFNVPLLGTIPSIPMEQDENGGEAK